MQHYYARSELIRSTVTGCSAVNTGGGFAMQDTTVTLIDVLVAECDANVHGGGIIVSGSGSLIMSGGTIRNCEAGEQGGALFVTDPGALARLSDMAVYGCKSTHGGGITIESEGQGLLAGISIEDCEAKSGGGAIHTGLKTTLRAHRLRVARCRAPTGHAGGLYLEGDSTFTDSTIMDCTSMWRVVYFTAGLHTFIRVAILRGHASGGGVRGVGGGISTIGSTTLTMLDSRIAECSASHQGGCVEAEAAVVKLRNTTLSTCSAPDGQYIILLDDAATKFESEMLTLELACETEHSGALISAGDAFSGPLKVRGLQVHMRCPSVGMPILSEGLRLSRCSDEDVCDDGAACTEFVPLLSAPNLTTVNCDCADESFPSPTAASAALAPYGFDPSKDYCVTPRVAASASLRGFVVEEVIRLTKTVAANAVQTLNLDIGMAGTDVTPATWSIAASTVPFWLSLPMQGSIGATEPTGNLALTASTAGLPERLSKPYIASLNLSVSSQRGASFLVVVRLFVSAHTLARTSMWGRPTDERVCRTSSAAGDGPVETALGKTTHVPFAACDIDGLAVGHDESSSFKAELVDQRSGAVLRTLPITYEFAYYVVILEAAHLGAFGLRLSFSGEQVGAERSVHAICPAAKEPLPNGLDCGCARGEIFNEDEGTCKPCPRGISSEAGAIECSVCAAGFYLRDLIEVPNQATCKPCSDLEGAECGWNATLKTITLQTNYWRLSDQTTDIWPCEGSANESSCLGGGTIGTCTEGQGGPRCMACWSDEEYYDNLDSKCKACPEAGEASWRLIIILLAAGAVLLFVRLLFQHPERIPLALRARAEAILRLFQWLLALGLQAKLKVFAPAPFATPPAFVHPTLSPYAPKHRCSWPSTN